MKRLAFATALCAALTLGPTTATAQESGLASPGFTSQFLHSIPLDSLSLRYDHMRVTFTHLIPSDRVFIFQRTMAACFPMGAHTSTCPEKLLWSTRRTGFSGSWTITLRDSSQQGSAWEFIVVRGARVSGFNLPFTVRYRGTRAGDDNQINAGPAPRFLGHTVRWSGTEYRIGTVPQ